MLSSRNYNILLSKYFVYNGTVVFAEWFGRELSHANLAISGCLLEYYDDRRKEYGAEKGRVEEMLAPGRRLGPYITPVSASLVIARSTPASKRLDKPPPLTLIQSALMSQDQ